MKAGIVVGKPPEPSDGQKIAVLTPAVASDKQKIMMFCPPHPSETRNIGAGAGADPSGLTGTPMAGTKQEV